MASQIEGLVVKYWAGETTIQEETRLRDHFKQNPSLTPESQYFRDLNARRHLSTVAFTHPGRHQRRAWMTIAASLVIGLMVAILVVRDAQQTREFMVEDPREAYEITRKALFMVSATLNEGSVYSGELNKINKAEKIVNELEK